MRIVELEQLRTFDPARMRKNNLFETSRFFCDLYCLEPGQAQAAHTHDGSDKVYVVLEGEGTFLVGEEEASVEAGHAILAESGQKASTAVVPAYPPDRHRHRIQRPKVGHGIAAPARDDHGPGMVQDQDRRLPGDPDYIAVDELVHEEIAQNHDSPPAKIFDKLVQPFPVHAGVPFSMFILPEAPAGSSSAGASRATIPDAPGSTLR